MSGNITQKCLVNYCRENCVKGVSKLSKLSILGEIFTKPELREQACTFLSDFNPTQIYDFYVSRDNLVIKEMIKEKCLWNLGNSGWERILKERTLTKNDVIEFLGCIIRYIGHVKICINCNTNPVQVLFKPCGDVILCCECALIIKTCAMCGQDVIVTVSALTS